MNPWQVLGVQPGSDRRTIKRAYTRLVKEVHPEDRPEDFMRLRQAYERAMSTLETSASPRVFTVEAEAPQPGPPQPFTWESPRGEADAGTTLVVEEVPPLEAMAHGRRPGAVVDRWAEPDAEPYTVQDDADGRQQLLWGRGRRWHGEGEHGLLEP